VVVIILANSRHISRIAPAQRPVPHDRLLAALTQLSLSL
jgi:hypothetical protein